MKVLFITSAYPTHRDDARGIFIHRLARGITHEGIDVTVIAPGAPNSSPRELMDDVKVHRAQYWIPKWQRLANDLSGIMPNLKERPWLALQIPTLIGALSWKALRLPGSFDIVHAHWLYPAGIAGLVIAKARHIPLVVTSHGGDLNLASHSRILKSISRQISRASNKCVGVSSDLCDKFKSLGVPSKDIAFIPYGIDINNATSSCGTETSRELELFRRYSGFRILYIGSLNKRKSVETLIDAYGQLEQRGHRIMCAVIGSGPTKESLQNKVREGSFKNIVFMDPISPSSVPSWMSTAHVLILPSLSEGRPVVVLEAMAMGLPVVATDIPGTHELIQDFETGLLFQPGHREQLANCIETLITNRSLRQQMGMRAKEYVLSTGLTTPQIAQSHIELYETIVGPTTQKSKP